MNRTKAHFQAAKAGRNKLWKMLDAFCGRRVGRWGGCRASRTVGRLQVYLRLANDVFRARLANVLGFPKYVPITYLRVSIHIYINISYFIFRVPHFQRSAVVCYLFLTYGTRFRYILGNTRAHHPVSCQHPRTAIFLISKVFVNPRPAPPRPFRVRWVGNFARFQTQFVFCVKNDAIMSGIWYRACILILKSS